MSSGAWGPAGPRMCVADVRNMSGNNSESYKRFGELRSNAHSFGEFNLHLQFTPKKRRPVFWSIELRDACKKTIIEKANSLGVIVLALEYGPDHVHLFVGGCKNFSIPCLAQHFKGYTAWKLRREFASYLESFNQGASFWSDGYFYESVGRVTSKTVKFYIERHKEKHWEHEDYDVHCFSTKQDVHQTKLQAYGA